MHLYLPITQYMKNNMSVLLTNQSAQVLSEIDHDLNITVEIPGKKEKMYLQPFRVQPPLIFIPFYYGVRKSFTPMTHTKLKEPLKFKGKLRPEQKIVRDEALTILNENHSLILSTHVGFGKSILATYLAYKIQMKTILLMNRIDLMTQWVGVLSDFLESPKVQIVKPNDIINWDNDFFIVNALNMPKLGYLPEIGLVIVDEVHLIVSKILSTSFQYLTPTYLIGLSATPYRIDGMNILFDLYFGEKNKINRQLHREHIVYVVQTGFSPAIMTNPRTNKVDWNSILNQQATNVERNQLVVQIVLQYPDLRFIILCKRVEQIKLIETLLLERNIEAEYIYGDKNPDRSRQSRILIGTTQKLGTGFDAPWLNALIVAADLEAYFIQYLGRVFRKRDTIPTIFDLVDKNNILKKHFQTREKTYIEHGGVIRPYSVGLFHN